MTDWLTDRTIEWLDRRPRGRPWFHVVSSEPPHPPSVAPEPYMAAYRGRELQHRRNFPLDHPRRGQFERSLRGYYAQIKNIDDNVGRLLDALERSGLLDETIVCYLSDHGDFMGSHGRMSKERPEEESANIPLIVRYPPGIPAGRTSDALIGGVDIMPTLLGLLGIPAPPTVEGRDLSATVRGIDDSGAEHVYIQYEHCIYPEDPRLVWRALRTGPWSFTCTLLDGPTQLFNLSADPYQMDNLIDSPEHRAERDRLLGRMRRIAAEIGDDFFDRGEYAGRPFTANNQ